jgi:hypothetical protein
MSGFSTKPAPLKDFEIVRDFKGARGEIVGDVIIFKRDLPAPKDELIIMASAVAGKAEDFQRNRPDDAAVMRRAAQAYQQQLVTT